MNWTMYERHFHLFSFLGGFLQIATEVMGVESVTQRILSTNWPHDETWALTLTNVNCWWIVSYWSRREDSNLRPHGPEW